MRQAYLGVDIGTESVRVGLFDIAGTMLAAAHEPVVIHFPKPGWAEADGMQYWSAFKQALARVLSAKPHDATIASLACGATSTTLVATDADRRILGPVIMWMDTRSFTQAAQVQATAHQALKYSGGASSVEWMVPKALWLKQERPGEYFGAAHLMDLLDWFNWMLTGRLSASMCNTVCKWHRGPAGWDRDFLRDIGLEDVLPKWPSEVLPVGQVIGQLDHQQAVELNLPESLVVVQGGIDAYMGMIGSNCLAAGEMAFVLGSSSVFLMHSVEPHYCADIWGPFPNAVMPGSWILEAGQVSTGSAARWLVERFGGGHDLGATYQTLIDQAARIDPGSEGVMALDHFQGSRTPFRNPTARGAFLGLSLEHTSAHLFRALLEATALGARACVRSITDLGAPVRRMVISGGGTRNRLWLQIHSDILQMPLYVPEESNLLGLLGCAMLGAQATGEFADLTQAAQAMRRPEGLVEPNAALAARYEELYGRYMQGYEAVAQLTADRVKDEGGRVVL